MVAIVPFFGRDAVFEPNDIKAMSMALDDICKTLELPDGQHPARVVIAQRIIELARTGERSPTVLRDRVLKESGLADRVNGHTR